MGSPQIGVIIPVYNTEEFVKKCIQSVIEQKYDNLQIIIVDDGTADNAGLYCDDMVLTDSRISVIHKPNGGLSSARNVGLEFSNTGYVTFIDSDDFIHPEMLSALHMTLQCTNADFSMCGLKKTNSDISQYDQLDWNNRWTIRTQQELFYELYSENRINYVVACAKLFKTELFKSLRFSEGRLNEDEAIAHLLFSQVNSAAVLSERLYYYRENPNGITLSKYTLKNLDCFYAKEERLKYFISQNSEFVTNARKDLFWTGLYNVQRAQRALDLNGQSIVEGRVCGLFKEYVYGYLSLKRLGIQDAIWYLLSFISIRTVCKIRNAIGIGE